MYFSPQKQPWWQTLPGILTAVATFITAIGGLLAVLYQNGVLGGAPPANVNDVSGIVGKWSGRVQESEGTAFDLTLEIRAGCVLNGTCGTISVSHVPCYGELSLIRAQNGEFEFRVDNFDSRSNLSVCKPGAGENVRLLADGTLQYWASYSNAKGSLAK